MNPTKNMLAGLVVAMLATSCSTTKIRNDDGSFVTDERGNVVYVQKDALATINAIFPHLSKEICKYLDQKLAAYTDGNRFRFPGDDEFQAMVKRSCAAAGVSFSGADKDVMVGLRSLSADKFNRFLLEKIYPALVKRNCEAAKAAADTHVAAKKFGKAREVLWVAPTKSGIPEVDNPVREYCVKYMNSVVNPPHWAAIEKELRSRTEEFLKTAAFDKGLEWLSNYPRIRTYSKRLDDKLVAVKEELVKVGVDGKDLESILDATKDLVAAAEYLYDFEDRTESSLEVIEKDPEFAPDLKSYNQRLEEYRKLLIRFNCTTANADRIVSAFKANARPLLNPLYKGAVADRLTKKFLFLGPGAINVRIDRLCEELKGQLFDAKIESLAAALGTEVEKLVAAKQFAEAREVDWAAYATPDEDVNTAMRPIALKLMRRTINPAQWKAIQEEVEAKRVELFAKNEYDAYIAWISSYPQIGEHTIGFEKAAERTTSALVRLGVPQAKVKEAVDAAKELALRVNRLVDETDTMEDASPNPTVAIPKKLEEILAQYRADLIRLDCSEEGADRAINKIRREVLPYLDGSLTPEGEPTLLLGCRALNNRIETLRETEIFEAKARKYQFVFDELNRNVRELVEAKKFMKARSFIRDVELVDDPEWDVRICGVRVGLLNGLVNPSMYEALAAEIDEKIASFLENKDYEGLIAYAKNYKFVHDDYQQILEALAGTKSAMLGLKIGKKTSEEYVEELRERLEKALDLRVSNYQIPARELDLDPLEKSLSDLEAALYAQLCRAKAEAAAESPSKTKNPCLAVPGAPETMSSEDLEAEILALIKGLGNPMTTWELNRKLSEKLKAALLNVDALIAARDAERALHAYDDLLAVLDAEVSFDSQIAMAEDAISKQIEVAGPGADLQVNALLGDYARAMRLLKKGKVLSAEEATTVLLGSVYLGQPAVFDAALKLGAKVDGVSSRDPLRRAAILFALQMGHNEFLSKLAKAGASVVAKDANGNTSVHYAVQRGNIAVVKAMLLKNKVDEANRDGESALFTAVRKNQAALAAVLTAAKANANARNGKGQSVFDVACICGSRDVLDVLADAGAEYGPAQLALAARSERLAVVQWLVSNGVDVNANGVMKAAACGSDIKTFLVSEGGIAAPCDCPICKPVPEVPEADSVQDAPKESKESLCVSEASGEIRFVVKEK